MYKEELLTLIGLKSRLNLNELLMEAIQNKDKPKVIMLIGLSADVNSTPEAKKMPKFYNNGHLMVAIHTSQFAIAEILLDAGADPNRESLSFNPDSHDYTPLGACINCSCPSDEIGLQIASLIRKLVAHGADIDRIDRNGFTHLSRSVQSGYPFVSKLLIELGAKLSHGQSTNDDAVMVAKNTIDAMNFPLPKISALIKQMTVLNDNTSLIQAAAEVVSCTDVEVAKPARRVRL